MTSIDNKNGMIFFSGHVPEKCTMTNRRLPGNQVYGELNCPDAIETDQGAYSCEAISSMVRGKICEINWQRMDFFYPSILAFQGTCFAGSTGCGQPGQDAILIVDDGSSVGPGPLRTPCTPGTFNAIATVR